MNGNLRREFDYYLAHQEDLVAQYRGRYIVLKDEKVIGVYDSQLGAVEETSKSQALGTFLVQRCEPGSESHTNTFHSRVAFA